MSSTTSATTSGRRPLVVALLLLALLLGSAPASAVWSAGGAGAGRATSTTLAAPTAVNAVCAVLLPRSIDISWAAPAPALAGTTYDVARTADNGATWTTIATGRTTTTLSDVPPGLGSYRYRVTAKVGGWTRQAAADSPTRTVVLGLLCA